MPTLAHEETIDCNQMSRWQPDNHLASRSVIIESRNYCAPPLTGFQPLDKSHYWNQRTMRSSRKLTDLNRCNLMDKNKQNTQRMSESKKKKKKVWGDRYNSNTTARIQRDLTRTFKLNTHTGLLLDFKGWDLWTGSYKVSEEKRKEKNNSTTKETNKSN